MTRELRRVALRVALRAAVAALDLGCYAHVRERLREAIAHPDTLMDDAQPGGETP